jgi:hypothetical protein
MFDDQNNVFLTIFSLFLPLFKVFKNTFLFKEKLSCKLTSVQL